MCLRFVASVLVSGAEGGARVDTLRKMRVLLDSWGTTPTIPCGQPSYPWTGANTMSDQTLETISMDRILANTQDGVFVLDEQRRFVFFNPACERLTGFCSQEVLQSDRACSEFLDCRDEQGRPLAGGLCPGLGVARGDRSVARQVMQLTTRAGERRWIETLYTPLRDARGEGGGLIGVMREITELREREQGYRETIEELRDEVERLHQRMREQYGFVSIVTRSPGMQLVLDRIRSACENGSPVLICGEAGTGKERVARTIHFNGLQKDGPFVSFSVAATPADRIEAELFGQVRVGAAVGGGEGCGLYRAADGGTLFIEGVDRLPGSTQARLLGAIEERAVRPVGGIEPVAAHVRVIASANQPLGDLASSGALREDLLYRLSVISIEMPPLRARKEDIPLLVHQFIGQLNQQGMRQVKELGAEVWEILDRHDWPGNVQELHNVIESAFASGAGEALTGEEIRLPAAHVSLHESAGRAGGSGVLPLDDLLADYERQAILNALRRASGQRSLAARMMGISRSRLYRRMEALGIVPKLAGM